jgi:hypothetical protein
VTRHDQAKNSRRKTPASDAEQTCLEISMHRNFNIDHADAGIPAHATAGKTLADNLHRSPTQGFNPLPQVSRPIRRFIEIYKTP